MDPVTVSIGAAAILFGFYTLYLRLTNPSKLGKLDAMKKQWGDGPGTAIHVIAYSVLPIAVGVTFLITGIRGGSIF